MLFAKGYCLAACFCGQILFSLKAFDFLQKVILFICLFLTADILLSILFLSYLLGHTLTLATF